MKPDIETNSGKAGQPVPPDSKIQTALQKAAAYRRMMADPAKADAERERDARVKRDRRARKAPEKAAAVVLTGNHIELEDDQPDERPAASPEPAPAAALGAGRVAKERAARKASQDEAVADLADPGPIAPANGHDAAQAAGLAEVSPVAEAGEMETPGEAEARIGVVREDDAGSRIGVVPADDAGSPETTDDEAAEMRDLLRGVGFDAPDPAGLTGSLNIVWDEDIYLGAVAEALPRRLPDLVTALMALGGPKNRKEASDVIAGCKTAWRTEKGRAKAAHAADAKASGEDETPGQGQAVDLPERDPWPDPVDGELLIADTVSFLNRHLAMQPGGAVTVAVWIAHSYVFRRFIISPRLAVTSATPSCGKSTLLRMLEWMVQRPVGTTGISPAALFRVIEKFQPSMIFDEVDKWLRNKDSAEALEGIINAGYEKGKALIRCVGDDHEPKMFFPFAPVTLGLIGSLRSEALDSRCIQIRMTRKLATDTRERLTPAKQAEAGILARKFARWADDNADALNAEAAPALPQKLSDRGMDNWRPMFAVAEQMGPAALAQIEAAAIIAADAAAVERDGEDEGSLSVMLLRSLRAVFAGLDAEAAAKQKVAYGTPIPDPKNRRALQDWEAAQKQAAAAAARCKVCPTTDLLGILHRIDGSPWQEMPGTGRFITSRRLARLLSVFNLHPKNTNMPDGSNPKGYAKADLLDHWLRYPDANGTGGTP